MKYLYPENYEPTPEPEKPTIDAAFVKAKIAEAITAHGKPVPYPVAVEYVQGKLLARNEHFLNEDIVALLDEVDAEMYPDGHPWEVDAEAIE